MIDWGRVPIKASYWKPILACHLKGIKDGVHYEYRETMPYKREPEFMEVSPKDYGIKNNTMLQVATRFDLNFIFSETFFENLDGP